jgi:WD40 repeat protein
MGPPIPITKLFRRCRPSRERDPGSIWDAATGNEIEILQGHESHVSSVAFSPDGTRIVTASVDKTARIWDAAEGFETNVLSGEEWVNCAAFSPDEGPHRYGVIEQDRAHLGCRHGR